MFVIQIIYNLAILVCVSVVSGFIDARWSRNTSTGKILQGITFGLIAILAMLNPFIISPGIIFDGRSIVLSLSALFFGPIAGVIAGVMACSTRIIIGGGGTIMGISVIASSILIGLLANLTRQRKHTSISTKNLYIFGIVVHIVMLILMILLPTNFVWITFETVAISIIIFYPIATVIIGKILIDQENNINLLNELRESEENLSITLHSIGDAVISTDAAGKIIQMNPVAEKLCGWASNEAKGKPLAEIFNIINSETHEQVFNPVKLVMDTGKIVGLANHTVLISKDGKEYQIADSAAPIKNEKGEIHGVVLVFSDVTEKYMAEKALRESEEKHRQLIENSHDIIYTLTADGVFKFVSPSWTLLLGHPVSQVVDQPFQQFVHPDDLSVCMVWLQTVIKTGKRQEGVEYRVRHTNGTWLWHTSSAVPLRDETGTVIGFEGIARDITERKIAEETLYKNEKYLRKAEETANIGNWVLSLKDKFIHSSDGAKKIYGTDKNELRLVDIQQIPLPEYRPVLDKALRDLIERNVPYDVDFKICRQTDGKIIDIHSTAEYDSKNEIVFGVIHDVTESNRIELERQVIYDITHGVTISSNLDELLTLIHRALSKVIYAENCFIALHDPKTGLFSFPYFVDQFDEVPLATSLGKSCTAYVFRTGKQLLLTSSLFELLKAQNEVELIGSPSPSWLGVPLQTPSKTIGVLVVQHYTESNIYTARDLEFLHSIGIQVATIIERKRAEDALRVSENRMRLIVEGTPYLFFYTHDLKGKVTYVSPSVEKITGHTVDEWLNQTHWFATDNEINKKSIELTHTHIRGEFTNDSTLLEIKHADNHSILLEMYENPIIVNGIVIGVQGVAHDITERKRKEEDLRLSESQFRELWKATIEGIVIVDKGKILEVNDAMCQMFGVTREHAIGKSLLDFAPIETHNQIRERLASESEELIEIPALRPDGKRIIFEVFAKRIIFRGMPMRMVATRDITKRKQSEESLREREEKYRNIFENVQDVYYEASVDGTILEVSPSIEIVSKGEYHSEDLIGKSMYDFYSFTGGRQALLAILQERGSVSDYEIILKNRDGSHIPCSISAKMQFDSHGTPFKIIGSMRDITERKQAEHELIKSKEMAELSDRLKSEFLAQMSHEIRTPINIIVSNIGFIKEQLENKINSEDQECFSSIDSASRRIIRTIELILDMSELQTGAYKPVYNKVDLDSQVLHYLYNEFQRTAIAKGIDLIYRSDVKETEIQADEYSIVQIFANLIDNAIKYTKKGTIEIFLAKNNNDQLIVEIKDTGIGIGKDFLPHLFKPFVQEEQGYTRSYDGNGLGLSLVKKYCEINNADIEVESEKNVGSTFRVIFGRNI